MPDFPKLKLYLYERATQVCQLSDEHARVGDLLKATKLAEMAAHLEARANELGPKV
jgi:hypothetical protein